MITEDQSETIEFLLRPETHGPAGRVERIETHISEIFLAGGRALKLKRAVKLPYLDFSNPAKRQEMCRREVERNRRTAPELYLGVRRITREADGQLALDGAGDLVDAAVEMVRFDNDTLFDRLASGDRLTGDLIRRTADMIAEFHAGAATGPSRDGASLMAGVLDINEAGFATSHVFDDEEVARFNRRFRGWFERLAPRMDLRGRQGRVLLGHGDLHLRNICIIDARPTLFDCIEFNDAIATVDALYDLAFLAMDLWHRNLADFANMVANRYVDRSGDDDGFCLLPFFMAVRAAVRAHVTATQIEEGDKFDAGLAESARSYFELAGHIAQDAAPRLIAIGGLSGSGKSTVAEALAPRLGAPPGARLLESDRIRKRLFGVTPETRLPTSAYAPEVSAEVYGTLARSAGNLLRDGVTVVADAVYADAGQRSQLENIAHGCGVPFSGIWLDAAPGILKARVESRSGGASDADAGILERQLESTEPPPGWRRIDAAQPIEAIVKAILHPLA